MTSNYTQDYFEGALNIYGATLNASFQEPLTPPNFKWITNPDLPRNMQGKVRFWQITIDEARGGMAQDDDYQRSHAGWATSSCDPRFRRHLILPLKTTSTSGFGSDTGNHPTFWTNINGVLVMTAGKNANLSLVKENTGADPTPVVVTYTPGATITSLQAVPTGGTAIRLVIGREGTTTDVHSSAGTSLGTMHTDFNSLWGMCLGPLNASAPGVPMLIGYANTGIYVLSSASAIGTQPAKTLTAPSGGAILGLETLLKSPWGNRVYMLWPTPGTSSASGWDSTTNPSRFKAVHINDEGLDPQEIKWSLTSIKGGRLWQRRLVCHDFVRVVAYDGEQEEDLRIFNNVAANSDIKYSVVGIGGDDATLLARVFAYDSVSTGDFFQWWQYMPQTKSWSPCSKKITPNIFVTVSDSGNYNPSAGASWYGPNLPWSSQTGAVYHNIFKTSDTQFDWMILPPSGVNPYNLYRQTGAAASFSTAFEASGAHTFPKWTLPTDGYPSALDEIDMRLADIDGGGASDATVIIDVATQSSATPGLSFSNNIQRQFVSGEAIAGRTRTDMRSVREFFQKLQVKATLQQATGETNKTPNALPIILRGHVCLDGIPRTYEEVMNGR